MDSPCPESGGQEEALGEGCLIGIEAEEVAGGIDASENAEDVKGQGRWQAQHTQSPTKSR